MTEGIIRLTISNFVKDENDRLFPLNFKNCKFDSYEYTNGYYSENIDAGVSYSSTGRKNFNLVNTYNLTSFEVAKETDKILCGVLEKYIRAYRNIYFGCHSFPYKMNEELQMYDNPGKVKTLKEYEVKISNGCYSYGYQKYIRVKFEYIALMPIPGVEYDSRLYFDEPVSADVFAGDVFSKHFLDVANMKHRIYTGEHHDYNWYKYLDVYESVCVDDYKELIDDRNKVLGFMNVRIYHTQKDIKKHIELSYECFKFNDGRSSCNIDKVTDNWEEDYRNDYCFTDENEETRWFSVDNPEQMYEKYLTLPYIDKDRLDDFMEVVRKHWNKID